MSLLYTKGAEKWQFFEEVVQDSVCNLDALNVTPVSMMNGALCCVPHEWKIALAVLSPKVDAAREISSGLFWVGNF